MKKKLMILAILSISASVFAMKDEVPTVKLKEVIISGEGFQNTLQNTAKTVYTVTAKEIQENGYQSLPEALSMIPGVKIAEGADGNGIVDVRGQGEKYNRNTSIIVDGVKMNPVDWGSVNLYTIPIDTIERIEVIPQNASVLFGDNTVGGVINIITKNAEKNNYLSFGAMLGSYNTHKETIAFNTKIGNTTIFGNYLDNRTDGYRKNSKMDSQNLQLGLKTQINKNNSILLKYTHNDTDKKLPGSLNKEQYKKDRRDSFKNNEWKTSMSNRYMLKYAYEKENFSITDELSYQKTRERGNSKYKIKDLAQLDNSLKLKYIYGNNKIITGIDYSYGKATFPRKIVRTDKKKSLAIFLTDTYSVNDKLDLNAGLRLQRTKYEYSKNFIVNPSGKVGGVENNRYTNFAFNLGGKYKYSDTGSVYLTAGRDFRTALTRELVSTNGYHDKIKPQEQYSAELGLRDYIKDFYIQSSIYYTQTNNRIYYKVMDKNFKNKYGDGGYNTNYDGKTRKFGYELLVEKDLLDNLKLSGTYSYINNKFKTGVSAGKYVPGISKHKFSFGIKYSPTEKLNTNLIGNYYGSSYAWGDEENNRKKVSGYLTLDMNVNYKINEHFKLYGGIKNLTNTKYCEKIQRRSSSTSESYYPAMERRYFAGFECKIF